MKTIKAGNLTGGEIEKGDKIVPSDKKIKEEIIGLVARYFAPNIAYKKLKKLLETLDSIEEKTYDYQVILSVDNMWDNTEETVVNAINAEEAVEKAKERIPGGFMMDLMKINKL